MLGSLKMIGGAQANLSAQFSNSANSGFYYDPVRTAIIFVVNGAEVGVLGAGGFTGRKAIGEIFDFAGASPPAGALICNGQAISRTSYAGLFSLINTQYGAGDGSTTFNVPFINGCTRVAMDNQGSVDAARMTTAGSARTALGGVFGSQTHTLTNGQMPQHNHGGATTSSVGLIDVAPVYNPVTLSNAIPQINPNITIAADNRDLNHIHGIAFDGSSQAHNNIQPTFFVLTCIQAL